MIRTSVIHQKIMGRKDFPFKLPDGPGLKQLNQKLLMTTVSASSLQEERKRERGKEKKKKAYWLTSGQNCHTPRI